MRKFTFIATGLVVLAGLSWAQTTPADYASGLMNPSKVVMGPNGSLLLTEAGSAPNSGRVSIIEPGGSRQTLIEGLPSANGDGPNGVALVGRSLFIANGEGDGFVSGSTPGTQVPNPAGVSSPLFASIVRLTIDDAPEHLLAGFKLKPADHYTLLDGDRIRLDNGAGSRATIELLTQFRFGVPDPRQIWRNSHPYGLTFFRGRPADLFMVDAGMNTLVHIDSLTGRTRTAVRFPPIPNPTNAGPPMIDVVPTSVQLYNKHLLVSYLSGAPFIQGLSGVMDYDPKTGKATPFIAYLSSAIDVLFRLKANGDGQFLVLEYSKDLLHGAPGRLRSYVNGVQTILNDNLPAPSSMAIDPETGALYITSRSNGTVMKMELGQ